jgi:hypothetical protein
MLLTARTTPGQGAPTTVVMLAPDWRVRPLDQLQWVLEQQDRRPRQLKLVTERWRPRAYCRTRDGLHCALTRFAPGIDRSPLAGFPAMFGPVTPPLRRAGENGEPRQLHDRVPPARTYDLFDVNT